MTPLRVITLAGDPEREAALATELGGRADVDVVLRCVDRIEALAAIRGASLDAVIAIGNAHWFDRQEARETHDAQIRFIALVDHPFDAERMRELGAALLPLGATGTEVVASCRAEVAAASPVGSKSPAVRSNKVVAVWGPKGSPGRTSLAIELADELAAGEPATLLIDADTYGGDVLQLLGLTEELPTLVWAARMAAKGEIGADRFTADLRRVHATGPVLLPGIPRADLWPEISDFGWKELLACAREAFAFTICDVGSCFEPSSGAYADSGEGRNRVARTCLREADRVVAVLRSDPVGIKNFVWAYEDLRDLVDPDRILIVANRVLPGDERDVADLLRRYVRKGAVAFIPEARQPFMEAMLDGRPTRTRRGGSDIAAGIRTVAEAITGRSNPTGFLSRLAGRRA